jgi:predicted outer membrane repeat protein
MSNSAKNDTVGGMINYFSSPVLTNCTFEANVANVGGGLHNFISTPILTRCTFIGNYASSDGGGIANVDSEPDLIDCEFISNIANSSGGAIFTDSCMNLTISNCTFTGNSACSGSTIQNWYSDSSITDSSFAGNAAFDGGIMQNWFSELTITNCLFTGNASQQGCAIQNYECTLIVTNCTISGNAMKIYDSGISDSSLQDNQDTSGETPALPGAPEDDIQDYNFAPGYLECTNCIIRDDVNSIFNNYGESINVRYSNILGGFDGPGNIDAEPLFANPGYWANINDPNIITEPSDIELFDPNVVWINGDYHLKSQAGRWDPNSQTWVMDDVTSPCIDAGDPNTPVGDEPFPNGGRINMGAYGGTIEASKSSPD